jgi:hypothetical protein
MVRVVQIDLQYVVILTYANHIEAFVEHKSDSNCWLRVTDEQFLMTSDLALSKMYCDYMQSEYDYWVESQYDA